MSGSRGPVPKRSDQRRRRNIGDPITKAPQPTEAVEQPPLTFPHARRLAEAADDRRMPVHMGRVNRFRRLRYADLIGCASADGTYLAFGPDLNLPKLVGWLNRLDAEPPLPL